MLICIYILINKVYFLSEWLLHWYIIYLKIFLFCMSFRAPSANLFFICFFFHLPLRLPILFLAFPCPACFLPLPISCLPVSLTCPFPLLMLFLCLSLPCLFSYPAYFCALPISTPDTFFPLHSACFLALPTSLPCLFPWPAFSFALPTSVPCLFS